VDSACPIGDPPAGMNEETTARVLVGPYRAHSSLPKKKRKEIFQKNKAVVATVTKFILNSVKG